MKFYVLQESTGDVFDAYFSLADARAAKKKHLDEDAEIYIVRIESITAREAIRRLLSENGGYADHFEQIE